MLKPWLSFALLLIMIGLLSRLPRGDSGILPATDPQGGALYGEKVEISEEMENEAVTTSDKVLTNIFSVKANVLESQPPRISLEVSGEHPDGCEYPVLVDQSRDGNTVNIEIYREVPADVFCPMILKPYQGTIALDGDFTAGAYTITVNSHKQTIEI